MESNKRFIKHFVTFNAKDGVNTVSESFCNNFVMGMFDRWLSNMSKDIEGFKQVELKEFYRDGSGRIVWSLQAPETLFDNIKIGLEGFKVLDDEYSDKEWNRIYPVLKEDSLFKTLVQPYGYLDFEMCCFHDDTMNEDTFKLYNGKAIFLKHHATVKEKIKEQNKSLTTENAHEFAILNSIGFFSTKFRLKNDEMNKRIFRFNLIYQANDVAACIITETINEWAKTTEDVVIH